MTLNITILTTDLIYQSADFRLTGQPDSDSSPKIVTLTFPSFIGFVTYTGIGSYDNTDVSSWITRWLTGSSNLSIAEVADLLQAKGTELVAKVKRATGKIWKMTFVLAGFEDGAPPIVYIISNFESIRREEYPVEPELKASSQRIRKSRKALVIVTGSGAKWVSASDRKALGNIAARYPHDSGRIRRRLEVIHQKAREEEKTRRKDTITPHCMVVSFRSDGSGVLRLDPNAEKFPVLFPQISFGMNTADLLGKALRAAGLDPSKVRLVQGASAAPSARRPKSVLPPCRFTVATPEPARGYGLRELRGGSCSLTAASAINNNGVVVGTVQPDGDRAYHAPWIWRDGRAQIFDFPGSASAVNSSGEIAMHKQTTDGRSHACVYSNEHVIDLHASLFPSDTFTAMNSWALAINDAGLVGGRVEDWSREKGQHNPERLPAYWRPGGMAVAQRMIPNMHNCRVVDANQHGILLIMAAVAAFDTRCILWGTSNKTNTHVGGLDANVFPLGLADSGIVLGQVNNERGQKVAVICPPNGSWLRLGTGDGWTPVDINNSGDVVGRVQIDGIDRPWLRLNTGELIMLPYLISHGTIPNSINDAGQIVGTSSADHGSHALLWET
jgi:hypothetical protein